MKNLFLTVLFVLISSISFADQGEIKQHGIFTGQSKIIGDDKDEVYDSRFGSMSLSITPSLFTNNTTSSFLTHTPSISAFNNSRLLIFSNLQDHLILKSSVSISNSNHSKIESLLSWLIKATSSDLELLL